MTTRRTPAPRPAASAVLACAASALVLLAGCTSDTTGAPVNDPTPTSTPTSPAAPGGSASPTGSRPPFTPMPSLSSSGVPVEPPADRIDAIRADLAGRNVNADDLVVVSAEERTWNDGSWGCPQPGQMYTQALVDGLQIIVKVGQDTYDYRFGDSPQPKLCPPPGR